VPDRGPGHLSEDVRHGVVRGHVVVTVGILRSRLAALPLKGDSEVTRRVLAQQDGPTVLVGHPYAGDIVSEAGTGPAVSALVYITAFAPDKGGSAPGLAVRPHHLGHLNAAGGQVAGQPGTVTAGALHPTFASSPCARIQPAQAWYPAASAGKAWVPSTRPT
jgi:hypothetical protein